MEPNAKKENFSLSKRVKSTNNAMRGVGVFLRHGHNAWLFLVFGLFPIYLGFALHISLVEWALVMLCTGIVLTAEAFNTAIEIDIDLTSPEYHPYARDTKDVAAAAVMITIFFSGIMGMIIFLPKVFVLLSWHF